MKRQTISSAVVGILLAMGGLAIAQSPTTQPMVVTADIPNLGEIVIDGDAKDWADRGMRFDVLAENTPSRKPYATHDASIRLGWNQSGLLVWVNVIDDSHVEAAKDDQLFSRDGVEMFFAPLAGKQYAQFLVSPGLDPEHTMMRTQLIDRRDPIYKARPPGAAIASQKTDTGYAIEALLPWSMFDLKPEVGLEVRLQVYVNDFDLGRGLTQLLLYPDRGGPDMRKTIRLKLADAPSAAVTTVASGGVERLRRLRVNVAGPAALAGKSVDAGAPYVLAARTLAGSWKAGHKLTASGRLAVASFVVPLPPMPNSIGQVAVDIDGTTLTVRMPDIAKARARAVEELELGFPTCILESPAFATADFRSPAAAEDLLGDYSISTKFYDTTFNEVRTAEKLGRYGTIVTVTPEEGPAFNRFVTLYRIAKPIKWRGAEMKTNIDLIPEFRVDPTVNQERMRDIADFTWYQMRDLVRRNDSLAIALAGISEIKPGGGPAVERTGPSALNEIWWHELKKRTGTFEQYKYITELPKGYAESPDKKWPLILFLHGSGERGNELDVIRTYGPLKEIRNGRQLPFIVVAPQVPFNARWNASALHELLDEVIKNHRVDPDRVYLSGLSMGSFGAWEFAMREPERFAALVAVCGGADSLDAARLKDLPTWVFHGGRDTTVWPDESYQIVSALRAVKGRVRFTLYPEADHDSWTQAFGDDRLYSWLLEQKRGEPKQPQATVPGTQPSE